MTKFWREQSLANKVKKTFGKFYVGDLIAGIYLIIQLITNCIHVLGHAYALIMGVVINELILVDFNIGDFVLKSPIANIYSTPKFHLIR